MRWRTSWGSAGIIVLLAFAVRAGVFLHLNGLDVDSQIAFGLEPDAVGYDQIAVNLWQHGVFSQDLVAPFIHDTVRTPLYPAFLASVYALVGHYPAIAIAVQIVIASLASGLAFLLARELGLSRLVALFAGLVLAFEPLSVMTANVMLTDTFFATGLLAALLALARWNRTGSWKWLVAAAVGIGLAALIRPVGQYLPVALLFPIVIMARTAKPRLGWGRVGAACLVFVLLSTGIMAGWAYRNYDERGVLTISTIGTTNLLYWRAADVYARAEGITMWQARERLEEQIQEEVAARELSFADETALKQSRAVEILRQHPSLALKQAVSGVARLMFGPGQMPACIMLSPSVDDPSCSREGLVSMLRSMSLAPQAAVVWSMFLLGAVYLGAGIGVAALLRQREWVALALLLTVVMYFVGVSAGADAYSRMRIPFFPLVVILGGFGLQFIMARAMGERRVFRSRRWESART